MVFPTIEFAIFFTVVLALSWALMPWPALWKPFILLASAVFYGAASWTWVALLIAVILANQAAALALGRVRDPRRRTAIVTGAVAADLGLLGLFKYYDFFVQDAGRALDAVNLGMPVPLLSLALPVGISFFVFQAISYVVDVKRGLLAPAKTVDVAIYLGFFPHLVAGPIVRAREFLPQLASPRDPRNVAVGGGVVLICVGLVKKVVLADLLARQIVDPVFAVPELYHTPDALLAAYAYTAQIYCDFSGYTDIAIGLALLMGFVFPKNFASPYRSLSFREFWRRWHITLSRYLRDFLYIPLGGNRGGRWTTARNLMLTMLLGGPVARRGVDLRAVGRAARHDAVRRALRRAGAHRPGAGVAALAGRLPHRRVRVDPVPQPGPGRRRRVPGRALQPGRRHARHPAGRDRRRRGDRRPAAAAAPAGRAAPAPGGASVGRPGRRAGGGILVVASTVPSQGVPPFIYFQF